MVFPQALASSVTVPQLEIPASPFPSFPSFPLFPSFPTLDSKSKEVVENLEKAAARKQMQADAETSSNLASQYYFQTLRMKEHDQMIAEPVRLDRSCPSGAEIDRQSFAGKDCIVCKGDVCELADDAFDLAPSKSAMVKDIVMNLLNELSQGHRALAGFAAHDEEMKKTEVAEVPVEVSWHQALSRTLSTLGLRNRMDSTMHEGTHYMDIVADRSSNPHLNWGLSKGLVLQLLTQNSLRGESETTQYVKLKTAAIKKGGWTALSVPWHEWSALGSDAERISYLAVKMASLGLFATV
mmetsp:Transcript_8127/g.18738  ORF Transcript_8127/g.18738 Transcript_8127/m.18738 type:complete len:296 (-) Transcript_8127:79-966(-)